VDSGNAQGRAEAVRFETNQAAAIELARQIRLRQGAGAFIADFLRLPDTKAQAAIIQTLRNAFAEDPAPLRFNPGFDPLGFYAFSRGRVAPPFTARTADGGHRQALLAGLRALVRNTLANPTSRQALYLPAATIEAAAHLPIALQQAQDQLGQKPVILEDASLSRGSYAVRPIKQEPPAHETSA
jgi:ribonuclease G